MNITINKLTFITASFVGALLLFVPMFASAQTAEPMLLGVEENMEDSMVMGTVMEDGTMMEHSMGPLIAGRMLHAWVSLVAAFVIIFLAMMMGGGALRWPIMLIGLGAMADAGLGLLARPGEHMQVMWIGSLIFSSTVVIAIIWIGKIFGVFQKKAKMSEEPEVSQ